MKQTKKPLLDRPWLSLFCLSGLAVQLLSLLLLNISDNYELYAEILLGIILIAPAAGVAGVVFGIIQLFRLEKKIQPILGIIPNSLWILIMLFFYAIIDTTMNSM